MTNPPESTLEGSPAVLVFGAYGGIGGALAGRLARAGVDLMLSGRDPERLASLSGAVGGRTHAADARDFGAVEEAVDATLDAFGRLDGVVNAAGSLLLKPAHLTRPEEWEATVATNLTSAFAVLRAAAGAMVRRGGGAVVLVSTAAARIGLPNHEAMAAAKGGIDALVRSAAATYGSKGIRVNAVAPGLVDTPLTARITGSESARRASERMHALGRIGSSDEVAAAIEWLLLGAPWMTGHTLAVDGGLGSVRAG